jgi:hypothetical protein
LEAIAHAKTALELECPSVITCADVLALAALSASRASRCSARVQAAVGERRRCLARWPPRASSI